MTRRPHRSIYGRPTSSLRIPPPRAGACACARRPGQRCRDANVLTREEATTRALYDLTDSWGARLDWVRARRAVKFHAGRAL